MHLPGRRTSAAPPRVRIEDLIARPHYRPEIDGLRAIAVSLVVGFHIGAPGFARGYLGVDVFFVVSGFLITGLLWDEIAATGRIRLASFYARRARRILPALLLVVLATLLAGGALLSPLGERQELARSAIASLLFVANQYFLAGAHAYFDRPAELLPLLHLWSLSIEEQIYAVWPLILIAAIVRCAGARRRSRAFAVAAALLVASLALYLWLGTGDRAAAFYLAPARAWEFLAGALLALRAFGGRARRDGVGTAIAAGGLLALASAVTLLPSAPLPPAVPTVLAVMGTVALIHGTSIAPAGAIARVLSKRGVVALGLLSYSWYLWHWPLLSLARNARPGERSLAVDASLALAALGLAVLTYRYLETPIRRGRPWASLAARVVFVRSAAAVAALAVVALLVNASGAPERLEGSARAGWEIAGDVWPHFRECRLEPAAWRGELPLERCAFGAQSGPRRAVLWGDSHADAWAPLLDEATRANGERFVQLTMLSCPPLLAVRAGQAVAASACADFNVRVAAYLRDRPEELRGVLLTARWPAYFGESETAAATVDATAAAPRAIADAQAGLEATLAMLREARLRVLILLPPPHFPMAVGKCVERGTLDACAVDRLAYEKQRASAERAIRSAAARFDNTRVIDPADFFCDAARCPALVDHRPAASDDNHVAASAARRYARQANEDLAWLVGRGS